MKRLTGPALFALGFIAAVGVYETPLVEEAPAGFGEDNHMICLDFNPGDTEPIYTVRMHRGSQGLDSWGTEFDGPDFHMLKATAMADQVAFDGEMSTAFGSWYSASHMTTARKAEWRNAFKKICQ